MSTLAYEGRRQSFFEGELLEALHILQDKHVALKDMYGSWAGAIGQCQFMPSSFRKYAVDEDQDGRKDIWNSYPDIFASIACYLKKKGWQYHAPWGIEVKMEKKLPAEILHHKVNKSVQQWRQLGIVFLEDPKRDKSFEQQQASLIEVPVDPEGTHKTFLVFKNFKVLLDWNSSYLFALSVGLLSDKIKR